LQQGCGVEFEGIEHTDGDQSDEGSSFRALKRIRDPVPAIGGGFLPAAFSFEETGVNTARWKNKRFQSGRPHGNSHRPHSHIRSF